MNRTVQPGSRCGSAEIPASKSRAHRVLICAVISETPAELTCRGISRDIEATIACLREMGHEIRLEGDRITVLPGGREIREPVLLCCGESGSTLRFLLPVAGAMGLTGEFVMEGRLPERPLQPLWDVLCEKGMTLEQAGNRLRFSGRIAPGEYRIPGNISSQYISGLLFALPLLEGESRLTVTGNMESADYIAMTEEAEAQFGIEIGKEAEGRYLIPGRRPEGREGVPAPIRMEAESDWSSAAFFLCLGAFSERGVQVRGMNPISRQGDRRILELLTGFGARVETRETGILVRRGKLRGQRINAAGIPDLVPVLAAVAAAAEGETVIDHAERLRLKESDRLRSTTEMLRRMGADIEETADGLRIRGRSRLAGGTVSSFRDHRIAMSAAVAASACEGPVTVLDAECTEKSFPGFWDLLEGMEKEAGT
ncbi:MAG: 3-phosphoshikimate 1-carboxyvinyltransferase [Clostridia bacterium]|nr:3-phosphoshikimate 1-carboxyvinyltransferase [Clostridia bacterium]